ncbi:hypothetical protein NEMIN01_0504 [Nematocida minor]|uniref:uncharacterized protein n=1 Tax=Nematocida minor TaxID=1912983 RepID=UPI00221E6BCC|nr:uncharacterized protein NEMIN01_0504 [Nematocida minor]KAI5189441.1 hypothetical protein NEMIN01_0504 [Nematocida minor]
MEDNQILDSEKGSTGKLDDHQEENKDSKSDEELKSPYAIVNFLRNIKGNAPVAFNRTFAAASIILFIIATDMTFYGKILMCLLEAALIGVNYMAEKTCATAKTLLLFMWLSTAFFLLIIWPISAYFFILAFIYPSFKLAVDSVREKDYLSFITSILGPVFIVMSFVVTGWVQLVKPNMLCVFAMSLFFFMGTFCNIGLIYKFFEYIKITNNASFYNTIKTIYYDDFYIEKKKQELARLNSEGASQNKEKIDKLKKEIKTVEQNIKYVEDNRIDDSEDLKKKILSDEIYDLSLYNANCWVLKSFSKYWFIILPVVSIVAGTGFVFMTCYLNSKMPVGEYIPIFFQKLKDSLFLGSRVISNTSA